MIKKTPNLKHTFNIKLQSYEVRELDNFVHNLLSLANKKKICFIGPVYMPQKKSPLVLLRSPHVHKKSREHFCSQIHKRLIIIQSFERFQLQQYLKESIKKTPASISLKVIKKNIPNGELQARKKTSRLTQK